MLDAVHPAPEAVVRLIVDGQLDRWDAAVAERVFTSLASLQMPADAGDLAGCFRWYLEEDRPQDTNAAFFIGLGLLLIERAWPERITPVMAKHLVAMKTGLATWFRQAALHRDHRYANKHLGDLVCAWWLAEDLEDAEWQAELLKACHDAADYWLGDTAWGWGEHLSDTYCTVMLTELSALLLFSHKLPEGLRNQALKLSHSLLAIEDAFAGGPRVPAIRSYAFTAAPDVPSYRSQVRAWDEFADAGLADTLPLTRYMRCFCGHLFHERGWEKLFPRVSSSADLAIPAHGGAFGRAALRGQARLGSLSHFPIMAGIEHADWGLAWQSFPLAFHHSDGSWAFLQWAATENGVTRCHPAMDRRSGYLGSGLSARREPPPPVGETASFQEGGRVACLRTLPESLDPVCNVADRLRILGPANVSVIAAPDGLLLKTSSAFLHAYACAADPMIKPQLKAVAGAQHWTLPVKQDPHAWIFSLDVPLAEAPVLTVSPQGCRLKLIWADGACWHLLGTRTAAGLRLHREG